MTLKQVCLCLGFLFPFGAIGIFLLAAAHPKPEKTSVATSPTLCKAYREWKANSGEDVLGMDELCIGAFKSGA